MKALIFDTETTGLIKHPTAKDSVQPQIIEWGGLLWHDGKIIKELDLLINPGKPLPEKITEITGITDEQLANQDTFAVVVEDIRSMFCEADVMIAHNLPFDRGMMELELARAQLLDDWQWPPKGICTVQEHAELFGHRPKLTELYAYYTGEPLAQNHRALDDVKALVEICIAAGLLV